MPSPNQLSSARVKARAVELGFDLCGIAPACDLDELARLPHWLARGYGGRMTYLNRTARVRADVRRWLPSARSVAVVANLYNTDHPHHVEMADPSRARIARYAWGDDYHDVMGRRLGELAAWMRDAAGPGFDARWCVDDGPVQEKVYAWRAGIGWIGKNTCVINPGIGSWILLGALVSNVDLEPDEAAVDRCGTCRLCVEACPTGAMRRTLRARCAPVPLVPDHRDPWRHPGRAAAGHGRARLRLRHLPGRLPVQRRGALGRRRLLATQSRARRRTPRAALDDRMTPDSSGPSRAPRSDAPACEDSAGTSPSPSGTRVRR